MLSKNIFASDSCRNHDEHKFDMALREDDVRQCPNTREGCKFSDTQYGPVQSFLFSQTDPGGE